MAIWEELNGINIRLMASERLDGLAGANIPQLREGIASTGDEGVLVGRINADAHDISEVVRELGDFRTCFNIPFHTRHVAGGGKDASIVDESAAGEVAGVARQFSSNTSWAITIRIEVVD